MVAAEGSGVDAGATVQNDDETEAAAVGSETLADEAKGEKEMPLADEAADDTTAVTEPAAAAEVPEASASGDSGREESTGLGDPTQPESSPGEKKIDDATVKDEDEAQPPSGNDGILLNFGDDEGGEKVTKQNSTATPENNIMNTNQGTVSASDFDLLGFSQPEPEPEHSSPDTNGGDSGEGAVLDNQAPDKGTEATADSEQASDLLGIMPPWGDLCQPEATGSLPEANGGDVLGGETALETQNSTVDSEQANDLLGITSGDDLINNAPQQSSLPDELMKLEPQNSPAEILNENDGDGNKSEINPQQALSPSEEDGVLGISEGTEDMTNEKSNTEGESSSEKVETATAEVGNIVEDEQAAGSEENTAVETPVDGPKPEEEAPVNDLSMPIDTSTSSDNGLGNGQQADGGDTGDTPGEVEKNAEERTQEEEEWISMGLGLGDALRQIVALTEERDSALAICQEKDDEKAQVDTILVEFQSRLQAEMNQRAEYESEVRTVRESLKAYEARLSAYEKMEDDLEQAQASLVQVVSEKSKIELEVQKLREIRDESQQKEVVLSNRLNEAKKKEANKSTAAGRLEADNENLRENLQKTKDELETTQKAKAKLENNMEKLKAKAVERVKQAETALAEERELNEERKKKMKVFVETKADELREAKDSANDLQKELEETRASLRSSRDREEAFQKEVDAARLKHRELQRDMERMKRNSEQLHKMGNSLEQELEKSASETEEHKKKRMSAKHEIMQMVRTLEAERAVSSKLRESVKFTFTPKALSQQELLNECLRDFELELERLASKTGKSLEPSAGSSEQLGDSSTGGETTEINGASKKSKKTRASKADMDTERLISNLEQETQYVSKGIMALSGSIERMRSLLNDDNMFGCMTFLTNVLAGTGEAKHQRLGDSDAHEERQNSDQFV